VGFIKLELLVFLTRQLTAPDGNGGCDGIVRGNVSRANSILVVASGALK